MRARYAAALTAGAEEAEGDADLTFVPGLRAKLGAARRGEAEGDAYAAYRAKLGKAEA